MRFGLQQQADGSILIFGRAYGEDRVHFRNVIAKGSGSCGLTYEELLTYAWIETDDDGAFVRGGKVSPADPHAAVPPFLRSKL